LFKAAHERFVAYPEEPKHSMANTQPCSFKTLAPQPVNAYWHECTIRSAHLNGVVTVNDNKFTTATAHSANIWYLIVGTTLNTAGFKLLYDGDLKYYRLSNESKSNISGKFTNVMMADLTVADRDILYNLVQRYLASLA